MRSSREYNIPFKKKLISCEVKNDPPPGYQILWQGYAAFQLMCMDLALLAVGWIIGKLMRNPG
jgi:hypothetical protein